MLQTNRLSLRDFAFSDFDAVHAYASDPQVTRFTSWGPNSEEETRAFLARSIESSLGVPRGIYALGVVDRSSGQLIGSCGLEASDSTGQQYMFGYCFHSTWWGRGFATEAASVVTEFGFKTLQAHRIHADVFVGNNASVRILERLGFRQDGLERQGLFIRNVWHDVLSFAKLGSE